MENEKKIVKNSKIELAENEVAYLAVFSEEQHRQGISKSTNKPYDIGMINLELVLTRKNIETGEITHEKKQLSVTCDPANLPNGTIGEYEKCFAIFEAPVDPTYKDAKFRFVRLEKIN